MKKRKSPVMLLTFLLLLVGAGMAFNLVFRGQSKAPDESQAVESHDSPSEKVSFSRTPESKGEIMNQIKQTMNSKDPARHGVSPNDRKTPTIRMEKHEAPVVQAPDPNRTAQQWYRDQSSEH